MISAPFYSNAGSIPRRQLGCRTPWGFQRAHHTQYWKPAAAGYFVLAQLRERSAL